MKKKIVLIVLLLLLVVGIVAAQTLKCVWPNCPGYAYAKAEYSYQNGQQLQAYRCGMNNSHVQWIPTRR